MLNTSNLNFEVEIYSKILIINYMIIYRYVEEKKLK